MRDAVIFDMDGLLLDSQRVSLGTFEETCGVLGIPFDRVLYDRCIGCNVEKTIKILEEAIPPFPTEPFIEHWGSLYHEQAIEKPVPVKSGVIDFLNWLDKSNIPCAVATSTPDLFAQRKLANAELLDHFSVVVGGDQVANSKPHPEIYLTAAHKLGVDPKNCMALEDSDNGVRAAVAAEMLVFQIPDLLEPSEEVRQLGHSVLPSMTHVHERFKQAFSRRN